VDLCCVQNADRHCEKPEQGQGHYPGEPEKEALVADMDTGFVFDRHL
jgi:hypothetical protein